MNVLTKPCAECPWVKGRFPLRAGRLKDIADDCRRLDVPFACHMSQKGPGEIDWSTDAVCRGFYDAMPGVGQLVRIMERLGGLTEIKPPKRRAAR